MSQDREEEPRSEDIQDSDVSFDELREELEGADGEGPHSPVDTTDDDGGSFFADLLSDITSDATSAREEVDDGGSDWEGDSLLSDAKSQAIIELLGDTKNVLLLGPLLCPADYEVGATLSRGEEGEPFNLLLVTFSQSADERLRVYRAYQKAAPGETRILAVGSQTRGRQSGTIETDDGTVSVDTVSNPADLTRIGVKIDQTINRWDEGDSRIVLCFHSLSALLQYVQDERRVFRFLSILRGRIQRQEGRAHYHMEDGAHDESLVALIRPLFDAVIRYDETGSVTVKQ